MSLSQLGYVGSQKYSEEGHLLVDWEEKIKQLKHEHDIIQSKLQKELLKMPNTLDTGNPNQLIKNMKDKLDEKKYELYQANLEANKHLNYQLKKGAERTPLPNVAKRSIVAPANNPVIRSSRGGKKRKSRKQHKKSRKQKKSKKSRKYRR